MKSDNSNRMLHASALLLLICFVMPCASQSTNERVFPQSKAAVDKMLKSMQASIAGRLPSLEGFASSGEHPLERYERGYYQATVQVSPVPSGGSRVHVSVKVTAWYNDPAGAHSGYQLLSSNGRLEADLLDQLAEQLAKGSTGSEKVASNLAAQPPATQPDNAATRTSSTEPETPTPARKFPENGSFSSSLSQSLAETERTTSGKPGPDKPNSALQAELDSLEEILKNQAHPKNLVAVKKSGTPVVGSPSLSSKPMFLASIHDEFEMLDFNADWVHVRISGISRGWIWRNSLEMPEGIPDTDATSASSQAPVADLFHVIREETVSFPGDWEPLRGKNVKIITVQKIDESSKESGAKERLAYAKYLLETNYKEMSSKAPEQAGIVIIFDSADGGMVAATVPTLQQWKTGKLSDSALWHKCFFDPPETFESTGSSASQ